MKEALIRAVAAFELFEHRLFQARARLKQAGLVDDLSVNKVQLIIKKLRQTATLYHRLLLQNTCVSMEDKQHIYDWILLSQDIMTYLTQGLKADLQQLKNKESTK